MAETGNGDARDPNMTEEKVGRAQRKIRSRRKILDAAKVVFFRDGFMAANLDEVAENASVAKGTLYRYFESKADLYVAVLADNGDGFTQRLEEAVAGGERGLEKLERLSQFYYDYWVRHPEYFQIFWAIDNQSVIGELPPEVIVESTPEYDSGDVDISALLDDEMESNYELNTVESTEVEDMLAGAKIVGDLPEEVDFELD